MRSDWILDVLSDIKSFAIANELPLLAEHLDDIAIVALTEITSKIDAKRFTSEQLSPNDLLP